MNTSNSVINQRNEKQVSQERKYVFKKEDGYEVSKGIIDEERLIALSMSNVREHEGSHWNLVVIITII